jgi:hypothetical protein
VCEECECVWERCEESVVWSCGEVCGGVWRGGVARGECETVKGEEKGEVKGVGEAEEIAAC